MYILENAFRNILRNRGRNSLLGAIVFVIIVATVVALMINNTTRGIIADYKSRFGSEIVLVANMQRLREEAMASSADGRIRVARPTIPSEQYIAFGESEYLHSSFFTASTGVNSDDLTAIDAELGGGGIRGMAAMGGRFQSEQGQLDPSQYEGVTEYMLRLLGNQFNDFEEGAREIAEGRAPEHENECIVSTELAELNGLSIGETISLSAQLMDENGGRSEVHYTLTVVGTYYDATDEYTSDFQMNAYTNRRNEILTWYGTVIAPLQPGLSGIEIDATYYLRHPDLLPAFADEVYSKGLNSIYDVTTDEASYNRIVGPVEGLQSISLTFMVVVLVFGGVIIALLSSIAIRERKYEIGVLRAMGMKKRKVALGLWAEMVLITSLCLVIGMGAGTAVAQPITNILLDHQIDAAQAASSRMPFPGGGGGGLGMIPGMMMGGRFAASDAQPLSDIDISLGLNTTLQMVGIALLLASLAGLVSISQITKYEPIKILMERN
jgi:putative ABC transport system permease protein